MKLGIPRDSRRSRPPKKSGTGLKVKVCGKDDAPLTMRELREGLLEAAKPVLIQRLLILLFLFRP
jgi:hypothetical protein